MKRVSNNHSSLLALGMAVSLAACGNNDDAADGVSASAPGVSASAGGSGVSVSAPGASASANGSGAQASAQGIDVATAQQALTELTSNVDLTVTGFSGQAVTATPAPPPSAATPAPTDTRVISVNCAAGGQANVDGYVNVVPDPLMVDVKVAIQYTACITNNGSTLSGAVDFTQTVDAGAGTPLRIETIYQGDIAFSGRINVKCPLDLNVLVDEAGRSLQVGGTFCGHQASELNLQIQPRWR